MTQDEIIEMALQAGMEQDANMWFSNLYKTDMDVHISHLEAFAKLVAAKAFQDGYEKGVAVFNEAVLIEREAIYQLVMEAPFKEFDRQEEEFDGEAANAMKAMAFSLTAAIRARGEA